MSAASNSSSAPTTTGSRRASTGRSNGCSRPGGWAQCPARSTEHAGRRTAGARRTGRHGPDRPALQLSEGALLSPTLARLWLRLPPLSRLLVDAAPHRLPAAAIADEFDAQWQRFVAVAGRRRRTSTGISTCMRCPACASIWWRGCVHSPCRRWCATPLCSPARRALLRRDRRRRRAMACAGCSTKPACAATAAGGRLRFRGAGLRRAHARSAGRTA